MVTKSNRTCVKCDQPPTAEARWLATGRRHGRYSCVSGTRYNRLVDFRGANPCGQFTMHSPLQPGEGADFTHSFTSSPHGDRHHSPIGTFSCCSRQACSETYTASAYKHVAIPPTRKRCGRNCDGNGERIIYLRQKEDFVHFATGYTQCGMQKSIMKSN